MVPQISPDPKGRREHLLMAGKRLFTCHGYRGVTIAEVAAAVSVSTGSFYRYFPDKETFFGVILDGIAQQGLREAREVVSRFKNPMNQLKALFRFITVRMPSNPLVLGILTDTRQFGYPSPEKRAQRRQLLLQSLGGLIDDILSDGVRRLIFRIGRYHDTRRLLISVYTSLLSEIDSDHFEELTQDLLLLIDRGLRRRITLTKRANRLDQYQVRLMERLDR